MSKEKKEKCYLELVGKLDLKTPIVFIDLETTGLSFLNDRVVQIAILKVNTDGGIEEYDFLVNPKVVIPKEASDIHGITNEMVKDSPTFEDIASKLLNILGDYPIGGYNSNKFDIIFLMNEFERNNKNFSLKGRDFIDVLDIERQLHSNRLTDVYKRYFGSDFDDAHNALADVRATLDVFTKQVDLLPKEVNSLKSIDKYSQGGEERVDLSGKLKKENGKIVWNFGKYKGKPVDYDAQYTRWVLNNTDVNTETEDIIRDYLLNNTKTFDKKNKSYNVKRTWSKF